VPVAVRLGRFLSALLSILRLGLGLSPQHSKGTRKGKEA
jgi:hypothetical protein